VMISQAPWLTSNVAHRAGHSVAASSLLREGASAMTFTMFTKLFVR